jgi:hypothetical protein
MRVTIDRNLCGAWGPACEECFNTFILRECPPDRSCITGMWDDDSPNVTAVIHSGHYVGMLIITPENRDAILAEGWRKFVTLPPEAFDIAPPHAEYIRTMTRRELKKW